MHLFHPAVAPPADCCRDQICAQFAKEEDSSSSSSSSSNQIKQRWQSKLNLVPQSFCNQLSFGNQQKAILQSKRKCFDQNGKNCNQRKSHGHQQLTWLPKQLRPKSEKDRVCCKWSRTILVNYEAATQLNQSKESESDQWDNKWSFSNRYKHQSKHSC